MSNEELVLLYQQGDKQALEGLVNNNVGIVRKIANKFNGINKMIEFDDLVQVGTIGLMAAANKYDGSMENSANFLTYAIHYIKREIHSCVNGRSLKDVENNKFYNSCVRLDVPLKEDAEIHIKDTLKDVEEGYEEVEKKLYLKQLRKDLEKVMRENTTLREQEIIKLRYGWDCKQCTFTYIGSMLGVSGSRTQQIEHRALCKIRKSKWSGHEYAKYFKSIRYNPNIALDDKIDFAKKYFKNEKIDFADKYFKGVI